MGLELTEDNIDDVLDEIRPYLVGETLASCFFSRVVIQAAACMLGLLVRSFCQPQASAQQLVP